MERLELDFGLNLQEIRKKRNLTAEQLAENVGISVVYLRKIETGERLPSLDTFISICKALGARTDDLLASFYPQNLIKEREDIISFVNNASPEQIGTLIELINIALKL